MAILWWLLSSSLVGWLSFPIIAKIFPHLPSKGFAFARAMGLLMWGYFFWLLTSVGVLPYTLFSQVLILTALLIFSVGIAYHTGFKKLLSWFKLNWRFVLRVELVFVCFFAAFVIFRMASPEIVQTEKPMELAFLNATLRAESIPPHDPWLSGHSLSYYYFGYFLVAMLARVTGTSSTLAFNLSQALWFGMVAAGAYGLLVDLLSLRHDDALGEKRHGIQKWVLRWALLAPLMLLILGNAFGFLDLLHGRGLFWQSQGGVVRESRLWEWMDLRELTAPPGQPLGWGPQESESIPWWHASRVLRDRSFSAEAVEVIDEFPNFSFILGDLHPHLLAMPFVLISMGLALDYFAAPRLATTKKVFGKMAIKPGRFILIAGLIGALAFLNTWDWPIYGALFAAVFVIRRAEVHGWQFKRMLEFFGFSFGMALLGLILYLPFFLSFSSQAAGILPSLIYFTRGVHLWTMFGPVLIPLIGFIFGMYFKHKDISGLRRALAITFGTILVLVLVNIIMSAVAVQLETLEELFMANQGAAGEDLITLLGEAGLRRLSAPGTWLTLAGMMVGCLSVILQFIKGHLRQHKIRVFVILLILWGTMLTLLPEYVYLLDNFGKRMNTIFKFYFQAWILWSLAGAYVIAITWHQREADQARFGKALLWSLVGGTLIVLGFTALPDLRNLSWGQGTSFGTYVLDWLWGAWGFLFLINLGYNLIQRQWMQLMRTMSVFALGTGMVYPLIAIPERAQAYKNSERWTLDGGRYYRQRDPDMMAAVDWLWGEELGVVVEAVSPDGGDYSEFARISMLSGMPTVLGWEGHVQQWRSRSFEIGDRQADIALLYETSDWEDAQRVIDKYNIEYIYIGALERATYAFEEEKFQQEMKVVFEQGDCMICRVKTEP